MVQLEQPSVVIWTGRGCGACVQAKMLLDRHRVQYQERRLKSDAKTQRAFARATGGARSVPQILIGTHLVGGFDNLKIIERSGELEVMLGRKEASLSSTPWQRLKRFFGN